MSVTLHARRLLTESGAIEYPEIAIEDGRIVHVAAGSPTAATETLAASFFDIHVHGAVSNDFMSATPIEFQAVGRFLASKGVAFYLPTTVTGTVDATLRALETLANAIESPIEPTIATPVAIHLEGPFVAHAKRGVHPAACLLEPNIALFDRFQQAARGTIRLMTLAPELPGAIDLIEHAATTGVRVSLGHSNATEAETQAALTAGAASATHTFNAMRALNHREPGILGTVLDRSELYAELICDGIHVHPAMVRVWLKMKGEERGILVTDGMSATGMPDGVYTLGDFSVEVKDGVCLADGALAGSVLTMDRAVANLQTFTGAPLSIAVRLASFNPARMIGMEHLLGAAPGYPANFNVFDDDGNRTGSILHGQPLPKDGRVRP